MVIITMLILLDVISSETLALTDSYCSLIEIKSILSRILETVLIE